MDDLSVTCGIANHKIYIYHPCKPLAMPVTCTDACITAVRDYMVADIKQGESSVGYSWKRTDGKTVKLVCIVEDSNGQSE